VLLGNVQDQRSGVVLDLAAAADLRWAFDRSECDAKSQ
jgi:hypothetical protein